MADKGTTVLTFKPKTGPIQRIDFDWTSDSGGDVEYFVSSKLNGLILALITDPDGTDVPTTLYDITIEDDKAVDVLVGVGADRSFSAVESVAVPLDSGLPRPVATDTFTFKVANAGNAKKGLAQVFLK
jgi:hypothetical protein